MYLIVEHTNSDFESLWLSRRRLGPIWWSNAAEDFRFMLDDSLCPSQLSLSLSLFGMSSLCELVGIELGSRRGYYLLLGIPISHLHGY
jgi:hypothetical protein